MKNTIFAVLCCLSILIVSNQLCFAQIAPAPAAQAKIEKIKQKLAKIGVGNKITVRRAGQEYYGTLRSINAEGFQIYEVDQKHTIDFKYDQLDSVSKGYGNSLNIQGRRPSNRSGWIWGAAIIGGLLTFVFVALAHDKS